MTNNGNYAVMREALENSNGLLEELAMIGEWGRSAREQIAENNAALSSPQRNCDVGSPEEQTARLRKFCAKYHEDCQGCPCGTDVHADNCWLVWAQMPYEE